MASPSGSAERTRHAAERLPPDDVLEYVQSRLRFGRTPDQIGFETDEFFQEGKLSQAISGRTIRNWIASGKVRRPIRPDDPWSLLHGHPEDIALVAPAIPLMAAMPRATRWLSIRESEAIARIRRAAPELPLAAVLTLGTLYTERERQRKPTADLDLYVASRHWLWEGESVEDWTRKELRYQGLARLAGVSALDVSLLIPGEVLFGVRGAGVAGHGPADGSWVEYSHEQSTDEWNEGALDIAAQTGARQPKED